MEKQIPTSEEIRSKFEPILLLSLDDESIFFDIVASKIKSDTNKNKKLTSSERNILMRLLISKNEVVPTIDITEVISDGLPPLESDHLNTQRMVRRLRKKLIAVNPLLNKMLVTVFEEGYIWNESKIETTDSQ